MSVSITTSQGADTATITCAGEIDVSNAGELREALDKVLEVAPPAVSVDLAEVTYIDSTGIGVLVGAAKRAKDASVPFRVTNPQKNVARVLSLLDVAGELGAEA